MPRDVPKFQKKRENLICTFICVYSKIHDHKTSANIYKLKFIDAHEALNKTYIPGNSSCEVHMIFWHYKGDVDSGKCRN